MGNVGGQSQNTASSSITAKWVTLVLGDDLFGNIAMKVRVAIITASLLMSAVGHAADLFGVPRILDGDTLVLGSTHIRLEGIDLPETDQICLNAIGVRFTCGIEARDQLAAHIGLQEISCASTGIDVFKRVLGKCRLGDEDLNEWMVRVGWALAYIKYSQAYRRTEEDARKHQRGLWQGAFIAPWDWRHRNDKTQILARSVFQRILKHCLSSFGDSRRAIKRVPNQGQCKQEWRKDLSHTRPAILREDLDGCWWR